LSIFPIPSKTLLGLLSLCLLSNPAWAQSKKKTNQKSDAVFAAPGDIQPIEGAWGLFFGQDKKTVLAMLENRGANWVEIPQCSNLSWPRTQIIFSDNPGEPKCSGQMLLQFSPVRRAELNINPQGVLTGIRLILPQEDEDGAKASVESWTRKMRLKYGKESCEVYAEDKAQTCLVRTWTGNDGSYVQVSTTDDGVMFNYTSAERAANLEMRGFEKVQQQNGAQTGTVQGATGDL
jgi:hypothetical protein